MYQQEATKDTRSSRASSFMPNPVNTPLSQFITDIYSGKFGTDADKINKILNTETAEHSFSLADPAIFQLAFLQLCIHSIYLDQSPITLSRWFPRSLLPNMNPFSTVADYLKALFFAWADCISKQYPGKLDIASTTNEAIKLTRAIHFVYDSIYKRNDDLFNNDIVFHSMLATLYPFILDKDGDLAYDINTLNEKYAFFHTKEPHPYVRLGGDLRTRDVNYVLIDFRHMDMRGAILEDVVFYNPKYFQSKSIFKPEFKQYHSDLSGADLRYANLKNTKFAFQEKLLNIQIEGADINGSNIQTIMSNPSSYDTY